MEYTRGTKKGDWPENRHSTNQLLTSELYMQFEKFKKFYTAGLIGNLKLLLK
jgi:hypothetical protein